jgi:phage terminase small subunit
VSAAYDKLTRKQRAFVDHYIATGNATKAARLAGYKHPRQQGSENLSKPDIRSSIDARLAPSERSRKMSADEVVERLSEQGRASLEDFFTLEEVVEGGAKKQAWRLDLKKAQEAGKLHLLHKLGWGPDGPEIELHGVQGALDKLARIHGLYTEKVKVEGRLDGLAGLFARREKERGGE